jgi:hypothetical protein
MYFMRSVVILLLVFVLVYCKTVKEEFEIKDENSNGKEVNSNEKPFSPVNENSNSAESWKESLLDFMGLKRTKRGVCGGGCISSNQCAEYAGGDKNCRCSWFSCKQY